MPAPTLTAAAATRPGRRLDLTALPFWAALLLIFVIPFENIVTLPGIGTASRAAGLLAGGLWLGLAVMTGRMRRPLAFHMLIGLFCAWNAVSLIWTIDHDLTLERVKTYAQLAVLSLMLWDVLSRSPRHLRAGLQAYVLGAYIAIGSTIGSYFSGPLYVAGAGYQRFTGAGLNADDLGLFLALGLPIAWHLAMTAGRHARGWPLLLVRGVNYAYLPLACFGIALSGTRLALVAVLPALLYIAVSLGPARLLRRPLIPILFAVSLAGLVPFIPQASLDRLSTIDEELAEGDLNGRLPLWRQGMTQLARHPLGGVGSGAYRSAIDSGKVAHNSYISVLVEAGTIGLLLFATLLVLAIRAALRLPKRDALFWLALLAVWAIGAAALTIEHRKQTWLVLNLIVCAGALSPRVPAGSNANTSRELTVR